MENVYKINGADYICEFNLKNSDGQEIDLTKTAMFKVTFVDDFFTPFMRGVVSIVNPYNALEGHYLIRGDGRDILKVSFKPKEETGFANNSFAQEFALIDEDSSSVNSETSSEGLKNFTIITNDAIKFMDQIPYGKVYKGKVGNILKQIFKEVLGEESIAKDKDRNDIWAAGDFTTEYFPPATFRYMDLVNYLLRIFYAKDGNLYVKGFINFDSPNKGYKLELLSKIFKENKSNTIEAFLVGDLTSEMEFSNPNNPKSGSPAGTYIAPLRSFAYLTPCYIWTNDYFLNSLVMGYDRIFGQHKIRKIDFDNVKTRWAEQFVKPFTSVGGDVKPFAVTNLTTNKKFRRYSFTYLVEDGVNMVEADMINNLTFYNLQFTFQNIGSPHRRAGKFIDIVSPRKFVETKGVNAASTDYVYKSDEKILGTWFITKVNHVFNADNYINTIHATKTYIGPKSNMKNDVK